MSQRKVLDAYAVLAFLENEPGADQVGEFIKNARDHEKSLLMSVVNWGEVFYSVYRAAGKDEAFEVMKIVETLPLEIVGADKEITQVAAEFKAGHKMSYADCFAAALAKLRKAELVTGDKEFKQVENIIKIIWL